MVIINKDKLQVIHIDGIYNISQTLIVYPEQVESEKRWFLYEEVGNRETIYLSSKGSLYDVGVDSIYERVNGIWKKKIFQYLSNMRM
jgi:hypothetical protein